MLPMWVDRAIALAKSHGVPDDDQLIKVLRQIQEASARGAPLPELMQLGRQAYEAASANPQIAALASSFTSGFGGEWGGLAEHHCGCTPAAAEQPTQPALQASLLEEVTLPAGSIVDIGEHMKIWRIINTGNIAWPTPIGLVLVDGDATNAMPCPINEAVGAGQCVEVMLEIHPSEARRYAGHWQLASPSGEKFGPLLVVDVTTVQKQSPQ